MNVCLCGVSYKVSYCVCMIVLRPKADPAEHGNDVPLLPWPPHYRNEYNSTEESLDNAHNSSTCRDNRNVCGI